jgi:ABC-type transport system involved in multi-copper enzyme maturation permease subunit
VPDIEIMNGSILLLIIVILHLAMLMSSILRKKQSFLLPRLGLVIMTTFSRDLVRERPLLSHMLVMVLPLAQTSICT